MHESWNSLSQTFQEHVYDFAAGSIQRTHVQPISVPTIKPEDEDDDHHDPQAPSSNSHTAAPTSFMPSDFAQPDQNQSSQGTPEMIPSQVDDDATRNNMTLTVLPLFDGDFPPAMLNYQRVGPPGIFEQKQ